MTFFSASKNQCTVLSSVDRKKVLCVAKAWIKDQKGNIFCTKYSQLDTKNSENGLKNAL